MICHISSAYARWACTRKPYNRCHLSRRFLLQQERSYSNHSHRRATVFSFLLQGSVNSVALCCSMVHRDLNFLNIQKAITLADNIDNITLICTVPQEMTSSPRYPGKITYTAKREINGLEIEESATSEVLGYTRILGGLKDSLLVNWELLSLSNKKAVQVWERLPRFWREQILFSSC